MSSGTLAMLCLAAALGTAYVVVVRRRPRVGVAATFVVLGFIPVWFGAVVLVLFLPLASLVPAGTAFALALRGVPRWTGRDLVVLVMVATATLPYLLHLVTLTAMFTVFTVWLAGYFFGRMAVHHVDFNWLCDCITVVFTAVAAFAIVEFVTRWHVLAEVGPGNAQHAFWAPIISRGVLDRSEGAFGHPIALGASLALSLPFIIESRFRPTLRLAMVAIVIGATATTLSRTALLCAACAVVLSVVFLRTPRARQLTLPLAGLGVVSAMVIVPFLFGALGEDNYAEASGAYRGSLFSLFAYVQPIGTSPSMEVTPLGQVYFGNFRSIDNQLLLFGLQYGALTMAAFVVLLVMMLLSVVQYRGTAAEIAVLAQVPALISVALITQYAVLLWVVVGIAVGARVGSQTDRMTARPGPPVGSDLRLTARGHVTR